MDETPTNNPLLLIASIGVRHPSWPPGVEYVYRPMTRYCPRRKAVVVTPTWVSAGVQRPEPPAPREVWRPGINYPTNFGVIIEVLHQLPLGFHVLRVELYTGCGVDPDTLREWVRGKYPDLLVTISSGPMMLAAQ